MDSPLIAELLRLAAVVGSAAPCDEFQDARDELEELLSDYECGAVTLGKLIAQAHTVLGTA